MSVNKMTVFLPFPTQYHIPTQHQKSQAPKTKITGLKSKQQNQRVYKLQSFNYFLFKHYDNFKF